MDGYSTNCFDLPGVKRMVFYQKKKCSLVSTEIVKLLPFGMFKQKNENKLNNFTFVGKNSCKTLKILFWVFIQPRRGSQLYVLLYS